MLPSELEAIVRGQLSRELAQRRAGHFGHRAAVLAHRVRVEFIVGQVIHRRAVGQMYVVHDTGVF